MKLRFFRSAAAAIAVVAGLILATAGSASASTVAYSWRAGHVYTFQTWAPGFVSDCLDDSNNTYGNDYLRVFPCNGMSYQRWQVISLASGWAQLKNLATNRCLDYSQGGGLRTYPCISASFTNGFQAWALIERVNASYQTHTVLKSGRWQEDGRDMCVDVSLGAGTRGFPCSGGSQDAGYQAWTTYDLG